MKTTADPTRSSRRLIYAVLITVAGGMAVGRILSVELVAEPSLSAPWPNDPGHPRRSWPATAPRAMPTFSSNDRSRWAAVRALVDDGTWVVGRRDKQVVLASAPAALAAADPLQLAVLLDAGYARRVKSDSGIITEDGWQTVDKVLNPTTLEFYSTKPPLLTVLAAGEYWLLKKAFGWSLGNAASGESDQRWSVVRTILITFNVLPFLLYLALLAALLERFGTTDWGRIFVLAAACFGTIVTPFLTTFNNHTLATCSVAVAVYAVVQLLTAQPRGLGWFLLAGLAAGFTAVNELPAAAFTVGLLLLLLVRVPRGALVWFVPAALFPIGALLTSNYAEMGHPLDVAYSKFGGPWYEYEGSHWRRPPGQVKRGIDFAAAKETKGTYAFHMLLGHHGWLSLTPVFFLSLAGMGLAVASLRGGGLPSSGDELKPARSASEGITEGQSASEGMFPRWRFGLVSDQRLWSELAVSTLLLSVVVIGYYIYKSDNYGGWSSGLRWLMWLSPLWLLCMAPVADRLGRRRWGQGLCLLLLALSVLSASYPAWNPWRHPWIYNFLDARGWIPY